MVEHLEELNKKIKENKVKLLVICATKQRSHRLKTMLESFDKTKSEGTEIIISISENDLRLEEYKKIIKGRNYIIGELGDFNEVLNYVSHELYPDIKYYGEINDDHIYRTKGWDKKLIEVIETKGGGWGIACGDDLTQKDWYAAQHPSGCIISGNIIRTLECFIHSSIKHYCGDDYLKDIGLGISRLFFLPKVIIEHMHYRANKSQEDEVYREVWDSRFVGEDVYSNWVNTCRDGDIQKLKEAMHNV